MEEKRDVIYLSSKEVLIKLFVLSLTLGISIFASLINSKSCYITILVQACNNMYDFYQFTDNKRYVSMVKREAISIIILSIIAIIVAIIGLLEVYTITQSIWIKLLTVFGVTISLMVVYNDYKINVGKENSSEV